jgi:acetyl-CoA carboxylase carboxyl transferase subunit beta
VQTVPRSIPDEVGTCEKCGSLLVLADLKEQLYVCPVCGHHFKMDAYARANMLLDEGSFVETDANWITKNIESFPGYGAKLEAAKGKSGLKEAVITGTGTIFHQRTAIAIMDSNFMMGSMGSVVGEKITRVIELAEKKKLPLIICSTSGGARMQEGIVSLMQMAKTASALQHFSEQGGLYISVLTHPVTGGVMASFAMLGDIILAEPNTLVGFAGKRVIENTIHEKLPETFQKSEFVMEKGFIDAIVERKELKDTLYQLIVLHKAKKLELQEKSSVNSKRFKRNTLPSSQKEGLDPWQKVQLVRSSERPKAQDYIQQLFTDFIELKGDRAYGEDASILAGLAKFHGIPVTILAESKGKDLEENQKKNFGMPSPEGYRKAMRLAKQAEKFHRPIITFVDTPGAYPGKGAEERGQAQAIAQSLAMFSSLKTPVIAIVLSEGGSGGALALSVADKIYMLENAVYSILSPEGFASILWKDDSRVQEAAAVMKMSAQDLKEKKIVDEIIYEPSSGAHTQFSYVIRQIDALLLEQMPVLQRKKSAQLVEERQNKYRHLGVPSWIR